jgi:hypothetical protein
MQGRDDDEPNRRRFSPDEDEKLLQLIEHYGHHDWPAISRCMPDRTPRQCQHRYRNYLADDRRLVAWTPEEDQMVVAKFREFGPHWVRIATFLPCRSGNDVKNRWYKHILRFSPRGEKPGLMAEAPEPSDALALKLPAMLRDCLEDAPGSKPRLSLFLQCVLN